MKGRKQSGIEAIWSGIVEQVDEIVKEVDASELEEYGLMVSDPNQEELNQKVNIILPDNPEQLKKLERDTMQLLEEGISLIYYGSDLVIGEMKADSTFLAKMSRRLKREVSISLEAPMAVGMKPNDRDIYLYINPIRLRHTVENVGHIIAIIRHELYHILYHHLSELFKYSDDATTRYILNIAQDCEINQSRLISDKLPEGSITLDYVKKESGDYSLKENAGYVVYYKALMSNQEFVDKVKQQMEQQGSKVFSPNQEGSGQGGSSQQGEQGMESSRVGLDEVFGNGTHSTWEEDVNEETMKSKMDGIVNETYNELTDKERGNLSGNFRQQIEVITHKPEINWRDQIKRSHGKMKSLLKRKTLSRPNRRMPNRLDLKGHLPEYIVNIVMAVDVSGSVSDNAIGYTLGEGYHLSKELKAPFTVVQIDTEVQQVNKIRRPSDLNDLDIKGRGGTAFQPAFDYLEETGATNKDTLLVYITDGYGEPEDHINRHGFNNVLWVLVDTNSEESLSCDGKGRVELLNNDSGYV